MLNVSRETLRKEGQQELNVSRETFYIDMLAINSPVGFPVLISSHHLYPLLYSEYNPR